MAHSIPDPLPLTLPSPATLLQFGSNHSHAVGKNLSLIERHLDSFKTPEVFSDGFQRRNSVPYIPEQQPRTAFQDLVQRTREIRNCEKIDLASSGSSTGTISTSYMAEKHRSKAPSPSDSSSVEDANYCLCQPEPKIPRPRNADGLELAFILYRQHQQASVVAQNPGLSNPDISKVIGEQWSTLPEKIKNDWKALAEKEKARHQRQYPDYRYQPRRNSRIGAPSSISSSEKDGSVEQNCSNCGGRKMNHSPAPYLSYPPLSAANPHQMAALPSQARRPYALTLQQNIRPNMAGPTISPPYSARIRPYAEVFGRPTQLVHDPRNRYVDPRAPPPTPISIESPDAKRRRINGGPAYAVSRGDVYPESPYQFSPRNTAYRGPEMMQQRSAMAPPARMMYSQPPPIQLQAARAPIQQTKRDQTLTLPPIKTLAGAAPKSTQDAQSQRSGMEAMVMSVPVLNKIRLLAQISPQLATPGVATPAPEVRGMIIAVEGMDSSSVYSMTSSLAEQLEKEGEFAVRIFGGPVPYPHVEDCSKPMTTEAFLRILSDWHKISNEMLEYITTQPNKDIAMAGNSVSREEIEATLERRARDRRRGSASTGQTCSSTRQNSVSNVSSSEHDVQMLDSFNLVSDRTIKSSSSAAIPSSSESIPSPATMSKTAGLALSSPNPRSTTFPQTINSSSNSAKPQPNPIPIAIVPHYQLTTIDVSAIAIPISDHFSPLSHWQWFATLWRGCIGPDVTVAVVGHTHWTMSRDGEAGFTGDGEINKERGGGRGGSGGNAGAGAVVDAAGKDRTEPTGQVEKQTTGLSSTAPARQSGPAHSHNSHNNQMNSNNSGNNGAGTGVEIRLADARAVIVRIPDRAESLATTTTTTLTSSSSSSCSPTSSSREKNGRERLSAVAAVSIKESENWEKAKRRVGFEVAEFLRS